MYNLPEHRHAYLMAVNHFDNIQKLHEHSVGSVRVMRPPAGMQRVHLEEKVFQVCSPTQAEAEQKLREFMIEQSTQFNHLLFCPKYLQCAKANPDIFDLATCIHVRYSTALVPPEEGRMNPPEVQTRPDKFAADLALMGVELQELPAGPRGRGCTLRFDIRTGQEIIIKSKTVFGELCDNSFLAYRSLLDALKKELEGFDATWCVGGVYNYPTSRKNDAGGMKYKATTVILPFSKKDTFSYDRFRN